MCHMLSAWTRHYILLMSSLTHIRGFRVSRNPPVLVNVVLWCLSRQHHVLCFPWNAHRLEETATGRPQKHFKNSGTVSIHALLTPDLLFTCVLGCSNWLVNMKSRFPPLRGLLNAKSSTGFCSREGDCGRSKVNFRAPLSSSSDRCTDGDNRARC